MDIIKKVFKNAGVIILSIVIFIIGDTIGGLTNMFISGDGLQTVIYATVRIAVTMVLAGFVSYRLLKMDPDELGIKIKPIDIRLVVLAIALPVAVLLFYAYILPGKPYIAKQGEFWGSLIKAVFGTGITAGICEELVFRGMIFRYMKKTLGIKAAVITPAILFACLHIMNMEKFDIVDVTILILAGSSVAVMFTLFALSSGSIYPGALSHTLWNTLIIGGIFGIGEIVNGTANDSYIIIPVEYGQKLLTGGNFGVEASIPSIIGYIVVIIFIAIYMKAGNKRLKKETVKTVKNAHSFKNHM
ncbi:MAG: CPBP family intramembrane metalloprotease [Lachnospiraceae bacterium]|nr:CPBP family intramembrane metalloprotease [Lachnospiraceae bacterium]